MNEGPSLRQNTARGKSREPNIVAKQLRPDFPEFIENAYCVKNNNRYDMNRCCSLYFLSEVTKWS